ncbi:MAG: response regulator [candidate division Zixibacteria bacterium]|nr:response regulator [candidate division Zixibacteria bacterium]
MDNEATLLVVDDEPNVIRSLKRLFVDSDYAVLTAESGEDGLRVMDTQPVELVISDYRMPGMTGVEFLSRVKAKYPDTIRIILSGYADVTAIVEAINDGGVYRFIAKPWNDQELLTSVITALEQHRLKKENVTLYAELQARNRELEELTRSLEEKVAKRTRDLESNNRALMVAQKILNSLPAGVLGIDADDTVVYMNQALEQYMDISHLELGRPYDTATCDPVFQTIREAAASGQKICRVTGPQHDIGIACVPLSSGAGVIAMIVKCLSKTMEHEPA